MKIPQFLSKGGGGSFLVLKKKIFLPPPFIRKKNQSLGNLWGFGWASFKNLLGSTNQPVKGLDFY